MKMPSDQSTPANPAIALLLQSNALVGRVAELSSLGHMKPIVTGLIIGVVIGAVVGWFIASQQARVAILAGPYSDNYGPALSAMAEAKAKLQAGDTNVMEQLQKAESQVKAAQEWSRRFLGQHEDSSPRSKP